MNTTVVCRDVRPATGNNKVCVVIASQDEREGIRAIDPMAASDLTEVRDRLHAHGIVLGGPLQPAPRSSTQSSLASPIQIIAHDEHGKEHRLNADHLEEYSLSSGSTLYYLYVPEAPCDYRWLVGRTLEIAVLVNRQPGIAEPGAALVGGRDAGSVADRILEALKSRPDGMQWQEIRGMFDKTHSDEQIRQALLTLMETPLTMTRQKVEKKGEHAGERFLLAAS